MERPWPLRGRSEPMARALSVLRGASQHGASAAVLVSGPTGIGKTALLAEICHQAVPLKFHVAGTKCDQVEQVWPGAPVIALLRAGPTPLAAADEYEQITRVIAEPLILADRIASRLEQAAAAGPLLIAIDDLHWADQISLFTLRTLVSRLIGLPVVWLLASRDGGLFRDLGGRERVRTEHIQLTPLTGTDIAALAMDRLGRVPDERARRFLDTADGNPFLAGQIIDGLARSAVGGDPVPAEFIGAVVRRVTALTEPARRVVHLVAVAGRPLLARDLTVLIDGDLDFDLEKAVADAVESGMILASDGSLTFHHDLVREAASSTVPSAASAGLHRALARYYLSGGDPLIAAWHARAAAVPGDLAAANILIAAAELLMPVSTDDAGELAKLAFQTIRPVQAEWLKLSLRCLLVLSWAQRPAEAMALAEDILARSDDSEVIGKVETEAAQALWLSGRISELIARTEHALKLADLDASCTARLRGARALAGTRLEDGDCAARESERRTRLRPGDRRPRRHRTGPAGIRRGRSQPSPSPGRAAALPRTALAERRVLPCRRGHGPAIPRPVRARPDAAGPGQGRRAQHDPGHPAQPDLRANVAGLQPGSPRRRRRTSPRHHRARAAARQRHPRDGRDHHPSRPSVGRVPPDRRLGLARRHPASNARGQRPPRKMVHYHPGTTGWAALTPAERRVALLIGTGHTSKSTSTELGVSVNTIGTHLRSIFAKLNIQSRVQLANELHKADLT